MKGVKNKIKNYYVKTYWCYLCNISPVLFLSPWVVGLRHQYFVAVAPRALASGTYGCHTEPVILGHIKAFHHIVPATCGGGFRLEIHTVLTSAAGSLSLSKCSATIPPHHTKPQTTKVIRGKAHGGKNDTMFLGHLPKADSELYR